MKYSSILFDMDGTIMKTDEGVLNSVRYALRELGREFPDDVPERLFMGPPLSYSFEHYCRLQGAEIEKAVSLYRVYYNDRGIEECEVYPGVRELLERLRADGVRALVASSKPEKYVRRILDSHGLAGLFSFAGGASMDASRSEKPDVIAYTLSSAGVEDVKTALMVGDREHDILGAKAFKMDSCGVLWGYGDEAELKNAGAEYIISAPEEILQIP